MPILRLFAALALWLAALSTGLPAEAHLAAQLFQGAETFESGVIRPPLPRADFAHMARMPNGLYQNPPEFQVNIELLSGAQRGETIRVDHVLYGNPSVDVEPILGERVLVSQARLANGHLLYRIADYDRRPTLLVTTIFLLALLLVVARGFGLKTIVLAFGGGFLLFQAFLPLLIQGYVPLLVVGLAAIVLTVAGIRMMLQGGTPESKAAVFGGFVGLVATALALLVSYHFGHVTGLSSPDALVLYAQIGDVRRLDYRQLWLVGAMLSTLGGLILISGLTARAIARQPQEDAWLAGWQELRTLLPVLSLASGLLYFGFSMPLLLITHLPEVAPMQIAWPRFFNFEYLASIILAWQSGIVGLLAAGAVTARTARWLRKRQAPVAGSETPA